MEKILEILHEIRPEFDFGESDNYIEDGLLDSFDIVSLISIIEETYNINIDGLDVIPENFATCSAIASLVEKYK
ncbi:MAG: acyl carrier protein [Eubacteriales bacterium]|nr:acyl carrier protein [Eubacteriales bacterium]